MTDLKGGFSNRVKAIMISSSFVLAMLGWAFSLGVTYSRVASSEVEVERLRVSSHETETQVSDIKERISKLEAVATSIDQTLKDIRSDMRELNRK